VGDGHTHAPESRPPVSLVLGAGLRLRTAMRVPDAFGTLEAVLRTRRPERSAHLPACVPARWRWMGRNEPPPETAVVAEDADGDRILVAARPGAAWTQLVAVPLPRTDEADGDGTPDWLSVVRDWRRRDHSLRADGASPARHLALRPPVLSRAYVEGTLTAARLVRSATTRETVTRRLHTLFLLEAQRLLGRADLDAAGRFAEAHPWQPERPDALQRLLDDLALADPGTLPALPALPWRCRAALLDHPAGIAGLRPGH
jgi:hypothetical protein